MPHIHTRNSPLLTCINVVFLNAPFHPNGSSFLTVLSRCQDVGQGHAQEIGRVDLPLIVCVEDLPAKLALLEEKEHIIFAHHGPPLKAGIVDLVRPLIFSRPVGAGCCLACVQEPVVPRCGVLQNR